MKTNLGTKHRIAVAVLAVCLAGGVPTGLPLVGAQETGTEAAKATLRAKINQAQTFAEAKYSLISWSELRAAMNAARQVADKKEATPNEVQAALNSVQKEIDTLEERKALSDPNSPRLGLSAQLFATNRAGSLNNVALMWVTTEPSDSIEIHRAAGKSPTFTKIYAGQGASFNDYGLKNGTYSYKLVALRGNTALTSNIEQVTTGALPTGLSDYSNQTGLGAPLWEPMKIGDTYYDFDSKREDKTVTYSVKTSADGKNWKSGPVVLDSSSAPDLDDYKLESGSKFYDEAHNQFVWWAHWERSGGYGAGRALVATAKPGERFKVHHIYNPLGIEVRDMSVFRDDDGQGYLVAASNVPGQAANETVYIFKMNADYTDVTGIVTKVMEGRHREAPSILKVGGYYYLFSSQTAGWYPSQGGYVSAKSLAGPWSDLRPVGNTSTFSAQSGWIMDYGQNGRHVPVMVAYRWIRGEGTSGNVIMPLRCVEGFVMGDYSPTLLINREKETILPLHEGTLLSQNQPATSSIPGKPDHEISKAFDGDYTTFFSSDQKTWPFSVTTDIGAVSKVRNVQVSWYMVRGSEAYYRYTIEGSRDGQEWRVLLERTDDKDTTVSKTYGFSSDLLPDAPVARYVRLNVQRAVLQNNPNNWYPPTLYEVKVYGDKIQ